MVKKKPATKNKRRPSKRSAKAAKTTPARKPAKKSAPKAKKARARKTVLPRPTITGEEKLFLLFKEDYHSRQIFDFLRVETVRELEQFGPDEIVKRLCRPIAESVERIRRRLADKNRYLSGDEDYLIGVLREARQ